MFVYLHVYMCVCAYVCVCAHTYELGRQQHAAVARRRALRAREASLIDSNPTVGGDASIRHGGAVHVVSPGGGPNRLHFDYCVVAVGASNGFWKPRLSREPPPPGLAALAGREDQVPTERLKAAVGREPQPERGLDARRYALQAMRERIAASSGVVVVGAGLVGVELAAEIAHFFPGLKVALVDGAPDVLPQLGEGAREYARSHGARARLSAAGGLGRGGSGGFRGVRALIQPRDLQRRVAFFARSRDAARMQRV